MLQQLQKVREIKTFFEKVKNTMRENNISFEEIDIEGKSKDEMLNFFKNKNVIHIEGGNTFYLLKAIRETGFAEVLKELMFQFFMTKIFPMRKLKI